MIESYEYGLSRPHICPRPRQISRMTWFVVGGVVSSLLTGTLIALLQNHPDRVVHFLRSL